jgi:hypothetical protein
MRNFTLSLLFAFGLLTTACPAPCDMTDEEIKAVYTELSPVARAIENYKKDQKVYPQNLTEISPKYLDKLPSTAGGRKFEYIRTSDEKYNLRVESKNGGSYSGSCSYSEIEEQWQDIKDK